jgi:hypothetical protein
MVTRQQQRLNDFDSDGQPPIGELMELLCEDHNGTYVLLPLSLRWMAYGAALDPTIRLMPTLSAGERSRGSG